jgi:hypothetical protein
MGFLSTRIPDDFDAIYVNGINGGYKENKIQLKFYQKTFGLVRIEFTIFKEEVNAIFSFHSNESHEDAERLVRFGYINNSGTAIRLLPA